ncbi:amidohydrolase family protein [Haloarchaeobius sp. HRN-SO-5]|uniref:metal-dependent hydrolase family protein n=1 Tax=Haloarchaeobius sp. HRN-SO-5 TaxID=3446118 RepID=UPI003EBE761C
MTRTLVVRDGTVVDVDGAREATVVVEDGEITHVGDDLDRDVDADRTVYADGSYVAPGLVDAHVHLTMNAGPDPASDVDESTPFLSYRAARNMRSALSAGVTTVRDLGTPDGIAFEAARAVEEGVVPGPRVLACGRNVVMTGGHGHWFGREADGRDEVTKAVREQLKGGADVVKCMATGGVLTPGANTGAPELTPDELEALVDAASAKGVPTAAHAHGVDGILNAVAAGIDSVEHGTFIDEAAAEAMAEAGTCWVPTASALYGIVDNAEDAPIPDYAVEKAREAQVAFESAFEHALDAGVRIAMGTDAGTPFNEFADIPRELELLVEHGLTPEEAFEAATTTAADLLGVDAGRVTPGASADLVLLPDDPREDVSVWRSVETVIARGELARR